MMSEQFESKGEAIGAAKNLCVWNKTTTYVYWFIRAIPTRGVVVDKEAAAEYEGKEWAKLIFTCSYTRP